MTSNNLLGAHECLPCTLFTGLGPSVHPPIIAVPDLFLITSRKEGKRQQVWGPLGFQKLQDPPCGRQDQVWGRTRCWETTKGWTGPDSSECEDQEQVGGQKAGDKAPQKTGRERGRQTVTQRGGEGAKEADRQTDKTLGDRSWPPNTYTHTCAHTLSLFLWR